MGVGVNLAGLYYLVNSRAKFIVQFDGLIVGCNSVWRLDCLHSVTNLLFAMRYSPVCRKPAMQRQRGVSVLAIIAVVAVIVVGLVVYKERSRAAAKAEQQRIELVQRQEAERAAAAAQREREALQEQAKKAEQEKSDLLAQALKQFDDVVARFNDASRVAGGTGRIALAQPVATMQALHREAAQLAAPLCLATGRDDLADAMKETVEAYLVFMQNRDKLGDILAAAHFDRATKSMERYRSARSACPAP